ncbi:hypothetical protein [Pantoea sp. BAV 3049]|uniref:hypothetical protein n=1 Tax=Pantoea sp. BAV 3049 TaxID=2654188 RepID=UPI00131BF7D1|nr:hypothetical protein [Pantoea sp. BAV 3049]
MAKSPAERKAAQRARQAANSMTKLELHLDQQELAMLDHDCVARRPGRQPYDRAELVALMIRKYHAELQEQLQVAGQCAKCGDVAPVNSCPCSGDSACWVTNGWKSLKLSV